MNKAYAVLLAVIVVFATAPAIVAGVGCTIKAVAGCGTGELDLNSCVIHGRDYGSVLFFMAASRPMMAMTLPAGGVAAVLWALGFGAHLIAGRRTGERRNGGRR